jgi:hypothetical protein
MGLPVPCTVLPMLQLLSVTIYILLSLAVHNCIATQTLFFSAILVMNQEVNKFSVC